MVVVLILREVKDCPSGLNVNNQHLVPKLYPSRENIKTTKLMINIVCNLLYRIK